MFKKIFSYLAITVVLFASQIPIVSAQSAETVGITVSPITIELDILPGNKITETMTVINPDSKAVTLYPKTFNFTTDNENGLPAFFEGNAENKNYTLSSWITFSSESISVAPNESKKFVFTVAAPADAEPGGHYGAVMLSTQPPKDTGSTQVGVVGLIGTLVLVNVAGDITEKMTIDSFTAPRISYSSPAKFSLLFSNTGTTHLKPKGTIAVKNWLGKQVELFTINEGNGNVLPESKRKFDTEWSYSLKSAGLYTVTANISYGSKDTALTATTKVFVLPYWLIIAAILFIALLVLGITNVVRKPVKITTNPPVS